MLPLEHYWPAEMLARVLPEKYRHLTNATPNLTTEIKAEPTRYTSQRLDSGCVVIWLGRKEPGRNHVP